MTAGTATVTTDSLLASPSLLAEVRYPDETTGDAGSAACARASYYGIYRYGGIKQILKKALDREPLPNVVLPARGGPEKPRFARDVRELLQLPLENTHAPN